MSVPSLTNALTAEVLLNGKTEAEKTFLQKVRYAVTNITVEPLILMAVVPSMMNSLATQNLNLEKSCRVNLLYNTTVCDAMISRDLSGYNSDQEAEVQRLVSKMIAIKMSVIGSWPVVLMLFLGAWSDRHGVRKPLFLAPLLGDLIGTIFSLRVLIFS
ncbi:hypothetical protein WA026_005483 [Henosepilachna vigintioctopunctata]|uniref:Solute carrier family 40 protein n=1 Tax=Henosepilachna vigintioctopunctata TaxID=420089 RepID=A0AAW1TWG7_9CUCU